MGAQIIMHARLNVQTTKVCTFLVYLPGRLGQETGKRPLRSSSQAKVAPKMYFFISFS